VFPLAGAYEKLGGDLPPEVSEQTLALDGKIGIEEEVVLRDARRVDARIAAALQHAEQQR